MRRYKKYQCNNMQNKMNKPICVIQYYYLFLQ